MLKQISAFYANALVTEGIISIEDKEIHEYGLTALLVNLFNYGLWLLLGILSSTLLETVVFLIS